MRQGQASETARRVAAQRLTFDRAPAPFGDPAADEALARDVAGTVTSESEIMTAYLAGRTAFFDRVLLAALERGTAQVVILAAGYDGRALRYARDDVRWLEVDHPATQADKRARLRRLGVDADQVRFVGADFTTDDVAPELAAAGHDATRSSLFLCEGIAAYLDPEVLSSLLRSLRSRATPASRLAISLAVIRSADGLEDRRRQFESTVAALGEPTRNALTPDDAQPLLLAAGWREVPGGATGSPSARARNAGFVVLEPT